MTEQIFKRITHRTLGFLVWLAIFNCAVIPGSYADELSDCSGSLCRVFSHQTTKTRTLAADEQQSGVIHVPALTSSGYRFEANQAHVDHLTVSCETVVSVPRTIYRTMTRVIESIELQPTDDRGIPSQLSQAQQGLIAFYVTMTKLTEDRNCSFPSLTGRAENLHPVSP